MRISKEILAHTKSYTSFYDLFDYNDIYYKNSKDQSVYQTTCRDAVKNKIESKISLILNSTQYVTSENYHLLNKDISIKSLVRSTSTVFYDLDDIAKRHSFHCMNDINSSNVNVLKVMKIPLSTNGFNGKLDAIVQKCATQIKPKLLPQDSLEVTTKRGKKEFPYESYISSEIFLRDDIYYDENKKRHHDTEATDRQQKFWSYAKYRTEYTNPLPEAKKNKKKERGKRTEDPCPCQLFSYACPCTDKKSLTELANNSKSLTVADQITSTMKFQEDESKYVTNGDKYKKSKNTIKENKLLGTDRLECIDVVSAQTEPITVPTVQNVTQNDDISCKSKPKSNRKRRKIKCPKCKENVDILLSTTDEEISLKYTNSSLYRFKEMFTKNGTKYSKSPKHKSLIAEDNCGHDPQCDLIPICQILPTDNVYLNHKCIRQQSHLRNVPKILRITKACRHHPPCTVVPSCQRANVLKNNCEFIPPCLHRPRCVNLPLCVPLKNLHYEDCIKNTEDESECQHIPKCKYVPECQNMIVNQYEDKSLENHANMISHMQNACELINDFQQQPYSSQQMQIYNQNMPQPPQVVSPTSCNCCKSNKSCQYDCSNCKCGAAGTAKEVESNEAVIFIRDVGCQFRNKRCSPKESDQSKVSSASLDYVDVKMGNYYTNVHTLRCEDKFTSPMLDGNLSETSGSIISLEIDSHCPTHGEGESRRRSERATGFIPKQNTSPYVAYTTQRSPVIASQMFSTNNESSNESETRVQYPGYVYSAYPLKSHRSVLKGYKKMFTVRRRKKSRAKSQGTGGHSRKVVYVQNL